MSDYKYDKDRLLEATNGGLDIILDLYPEADKKGGRWQHFKMDEGDKTASSIIFPVGEIYTVKNFSDGVNYTPFDVVMHKMGIDFAEAVKWVASRFEIDGEKVQFNRAVLEVKKANKTQKDGDYHFEYNNYLSDFELSVLGPMVTNKIALEFNLKSCKYFIQVKQYRDHHKYGNSLMQIITKSSEKYPIFVFDMGEWQKIYQPLNENKKYRFRYAGDKLPHFLFGRELIEEYYQPLPKGVNENSKTDLRKLEKDGEGDNRADVIIIAGGDRDALNVASLDYPVVWKNSETEDLQDSEYRFLKARCKKLVYLGDIDNTGVKETVKTALNHIDIHIAWLPEWLKERKYRGNAQKDMTDFCKAVYSEHSPGKLPNLFRKIIDVALPARFWDVVYTEAGTFKGYSFNSEACFRFLTYNGFYTVEEKDSQDDYSWVRIENNIVRRVKFHHVANFPAEYVKQNRKGNALLNFLHDTGKITDKKLSKIDKINIDFDNAGKEYQRFYFKNEIWKVTPETIERERYGDLEGHLWESKIIPHEVHVLKNRLFTIKKVEGIWDIEIHDKTNHFLNFLINNSRLHWRVLGDKPFKERRQRLTEKDPIKRAAMEAQIWKEREEYRDKNQYDIAEPDLGIDLVREQKLCLINKLFALGYATHRYKTRAKAWIGWAMDFRISDSTASNGGSGKSIVWDQALREIFPDHAYIDGTDKEGMKKDFVWDPIKSESDVVTIDDIDQYFKVRSLYNNTTGDWNINPKFGKKFVREFADSPKAFVTTNFGLFDAKDSTLRRLIINLHSDFYHTKNDDDPEQWNYKTETGVTLFEDFDKDEYNQFYNLMAQVCQFYLSTDEKIDPPMDHVDKRNALQTMGDNFKHWADGFFTKLKFNRLVVKSVAMADARNNDVQLTPQKFKLALEQWAKYYRYEFNPKEFLNNQGYCKYNVNGTTQECIVIRTSFAESVNMNAFNGSEPAHENFNSSGQVNLEDLAADDDDVPY